MNLSSTASRDLSSRQLEGLFDRDFYLRQYPELATAGVDPLVHYLEHGAYEGRWPNPLFDSAYYLKTYPEGETSAGMNPLVHYLQVGAWSGRWPNPLFDTGYYLKRYPDVAASGMNPLVHYLERGAAEGRWPNPLFDSGYYLRRYGDIASAGLNPLAHYLRAGAFEGRWPNPLFDSDFYLQNYPGLKMAGETPLAHYLRRGGVEGRWPNALFDGSYYCERYPDIASAGLNPLVHYIEFGAAEGRWPNPLFDGLYYSSRYPQIANAGLNPLQHYLAYGAAEGRKPNALFDPEYYVRRYDDVAASKLNPLTHYLKYGLPAGFHPCALSERLAEIFDRECADRIGDYCVTYRLEARTSGYQAPAPNQRQAEVWREQIKQQLARRPNSAARVSVIIPVYNHLNFTMACVQSLLDMETDIPFEIIVADDASTDATPEAFSDFQSGIRYLRSDTNRGFIANCNAAARVAEGSLLLFLNNDTIPLPGWLDELVGTLDLDPTIGLVGSKFLFGDGLLQEAGGIIWRDGSAWNYGRGQDPRRPEFSYMRDADYISGASILLPRTVWEELGGFDDWYDVAYAEDSDLAFRVRASGRRVVFQPLSMLIHFEGVSSGTDVSEGVKAYQVTNARKFLERWNTVLSSHRPNGEDPARERERAVKQRLLVIDACTPAPDEDAGSVTCFELMRAFQAVGFKVTFMPQSNLLYMPKQTSALQRIGIEAIYYPYYASQEQYIEEQGHLYDVVLIFRHQCAFPLLESVRRHAPQAKIMFHVSDLHFVREEREAVLRPSASVGSKMTKARELYCILGSDLTIVHSEYEKEVLARQTPESCVFVFPWILETKPAGADFLARRDIAFLGGYAHPPNVDAVLHFTEAIWPTIHAAEPDMVFHVVGSHCPEVIQSLHGRQNINVVGYVEDLGAIFDKMRISVAPIRYGAGIKGKVAMAMSYGVPVVATSCGAEGMVLRDEETILVRDEPDEFAAGVIELYRDQRNWSRLASAGRAQIEADYSEKRGLERVRRMVELVMAPDLAKREGELL